MSRHATTWNKRDAAESALLKVAAQLKLLWVEAGPLDGWTWTLFHGWVPVEIKSKDGRLTDGQREFIAQCQQTGRPCFVWRTTEDIIRATRPPVMTARYTGT